jgi:hypothetical protein
MFTGIVISSLVILVPIGLVILILYLIYKRLKDKEKEQFEKRDN